MLDLPLICEFPSAVPSQRGISSRLPLCGRWYAGSPLQDGVFVDVDTLPGGSLTDFNLGNTGVHFPLKRHFHHTQSARPHACKLRCTDLER